MPFDPMTYIQDRKDAKRRASGFQQALNGFDLFSTLENNIPQLQGLFQDFQDANNMPATGAINPLTDIEAYRVNPYRGYLAQNGGLMSMYNDPEKLFLGKLVRGIGRGIGAIGNGIFQGVKGIADFGLSSLGMENVINNSFVDNSGFLTGLSGFIGDVAPTALNLVAPGVGTAIGAGANLINGATFGEQDMGRKQAPGIFNTLSTLGNVAGSVIGASGGSLSESLSNFGDGLLGNSSFLTGLGNLGNNAGAIQGINALTPQMQVPGIGGGFTGLGTGMATRNPFEVRPEARLMSILSQIANPNPFSFKNGGYVTPPGPLVPVQTEQYRKVPEYVVMPNLEISKVNAKKTHEQMDDEVITDFVPENSYVASSRPEMSIKAKDLEDFVVGWDIKSYKHGETVPMPEKITAASILGSQKKIKPAEYAKLIADKFPVMHNEDIFTQATDEANLASRSPYIAALISLGEANRLDNEGVPTFKNGGVPKANFGQFLGNVLPAVGSFFGFGSPGADQPINPIDPLNNALMLGSFGLSSAGIIDNVRAQRRALNNALDGQTALTGQLGNINNASTLAGLASTLSQQTDLPELQQDFSRLANFQTTTPQSFIDAAAVPTISASSLIDRLGPNAAVSAIANQQAQSIASRNAAAANAFNQDRNLRFNIDGTITNGLNQQRQFNNQIRRQEIAARNNLIGQAGSQVQNGLQNQARLASNDFTNRTQLELQRAMLQGQATGAIGQQLMNLGATRQTLMQPRYPSQVMTDPSVFGPNAPAPASAGFLNRIGSIASSVGNMFQDPGPGFGIQMIQSQPFNLTGGPTNFGLLGPLGGGRINSPLTGRFGTPPFATSTLPPG